MLALGKFNKLWQMEDEVTGSLSIETQTNKEFVKENKSMKFAEASTVFFLNKKYM